MSSATQSSGYFRWPTVHGDRVVFVSEDDLWEVPLSGGAAHRLTSGLGEARYPAFSPDGSKIAYVGTEEGSTEVFVMDAGGGPGRQLTFYGTATAVVGWTPDGSKIRFRTNHGQYSVRKPTIFEVSPDGGQPKQSGLGPAYWFGDEPGGNGRVIGRNADDLARWKRYRGGTAGQMWVDRGEGWQRLLPELESGLVRPMWIGGRIYFLCDEHGYGNLYSCTPTGEDLQQHTRHRGFYARFTHSDGKTIVYTVGGDLYRFDAASGVSARIEVSYASPRTQLNRKFVHADDYLDGFALHPRGHSLAVTARGKAFNFGNWEGAVRQTGEQQGVRYRLPQYAKDGNQVVVLSDAGGEERFEIHTCDGSAAPRVVAHEDVGRPNEVLVSPDGKHVALSNHRHELMVVDLETGATRRVDHGPGLGIVGFDWSPDSRYVAYAIWDTWKTSHLRIVDTCEWMIRDVTDPGFKDVTPCFDPRGRYLYFVSSRWFDPVYDSLFFEVSFPKSAKPCVITLQKDLESLFLEKPRPLDGDDEDEDEDDKLDDDEAPLPPKGGTGEDKKETGEKKDERDKEPEPVEIDFDRIGERIEAFNVPVGHYHGMAATEDRVFWLLYAEHEDDGEDDGKHGGGTLQYYELDKRRQRTFAHNVSDFAFSLDRKTLVYEGQNGLRVVSSGSDGPNDDEEGRPSRKTGWIDLGRIPVAVEPRAEWGQMLREAWRLMRDNYWRADLMGMDWEAVWTRYSGLLDRVSSRSEFSDLVWAMQGELGTSHAYEFGGDYRQPPRYSPGLLGVDASWDPQAAAYRIDHIVRGSGWNRGESSPLTAPGVNVEEGEHIVAVNGRRLREDFDLHHALVHQAGQEVEIVVRAADGETRTRTVRALRHEFSARYREWVDQNRRKVHLASDGLLGYIHIPDMSPYGYAEFHRGFLPELRRHGLVVDVRNNGGGHVSQLILEKLARKRIGYDVGRWTQPLPYPDESIPGPIVALTDENAGSDGDIFSHCFKLMKLGPLVGKRTWGGVVGIWPRHALVDGSITTQPEFAFWFEDVGFGVENWGTAPDVEVELPPEAESAGADPQLDKAIEVALEMLRENPPKLPEFGRSTTILSPPTED